jgi:iron complex outermembrane receptor protein
VVNRISNSFRRGLAGASAAALLVAGAQAAHAAEAADAADAATVREVVVTPAPSSGPGVDADKLPGAVVSLGAADFQREGSPVVTDALAQRAAGVSLSDTQGNGFARSLNYRGFAASPLQGTPQGLAVYMGGVRLNEAFGDTVNWDLIPEAAIARADLITGDPAFGLNALGGAVALSMKTGRSFQGGAASLQGGSFGHVFGSLELGGTNGAWSHYVAIDGGHDDGWRPQSASQAVRAYGDLGWSGERAELHLILAGGDTRLGVVGPTPVDLLAANRQAIYTFPQTTRDRSGLVALNGSWQASEAWSAQGGVYARAFRQSHLDGNDGDFEGCSRNPANPLFGTLCLQDDAFPDALGVPASAFQVQALNGTPIGCPPLVAGQTKLCNGVPYGTLDRTKTQAATYGVSLAVTRDGPLGGHGNVFSAGASFEHSRVRFSSSSTLGLIFPDLSVRTDGGVPGEGLKIKTGGDIAYSPVELRASVEDVGVYATDTFDLTPSLFLTLSGRFNSQRLATDDLTGASPDLNGRHRFERFNPAAGLAWKATDWVTLFGGYAETNRAPTPLELSCSDPDRPCLLENALVADPPLKQVVSRTWQAGLRGGTDAAGGHLDWSFSAYRTESADDIIALASAIAGRGSFANVPKTRREGLEAEASWRSDRWFAYIAASETQATYQFTGALAAPNNPFADADGNVHVTPGDRIGGVPPGRLKLGTDYAATARLTLGADVLAVSAQRRVGDEAGQDRKLAGYAAASLHATYAIGHGVEVFGRIDNLLDRRYATFGTYFGTDGTVNVHPNPLPDDPDPRTNTLAPPRSFQVGVRARW